jgi:hypothetical protein
VGVAAVFDALYLMTTPGRVGLAAAYTAPIIAAVLGGIAIASTDGNWTRGMLSGATPAMAAGAWWLLSQLSRTPAPPAPTGHDRRTHHQQIHTGPTRS